MGVETFRSKETERETLLSENSSRSGRYDAFRLASEAKDLEDFHNICYYLKNIADKETDNELKRDINSFIDDQMKKGNKHEFKKMTPLGTIQYFIEEANKEKNDKMERWFLDQWNALYNSSKKKHFVTSSDGSTEVPSNQAHENPLEVPSNQTQGESVKASGDKKDESAKSGDNGKHEGVRPTDLHRQELRKEKSKLGKFLKKYLWGMVLKKPLAFAARMALDTAIWIPRTFVYLPLKYTYKGAKFWGKTALYELKYNRKQLLAAATVGTGIGFVLTIGNVPAAVVMGTAIGLPIYIAAKAIYYGGKLPEPPAEQPSSWKDRARELKNYQGRYQNRVNKIGDAMLKWYEALEGKKDKDKNPHDDSDRASDSSPQGDDRSNNDPRTGAPEDPPNNQGPETNALGDGSSRTGAPGNAVSDTGQKVSGTDTPRPEGRPENRGPNTNPPSDGAPGTSNNRRRGFWRGLIGDYYRARYNPYSPYYNQYPWR